MSLKYFSILQPMKDDVKFEYVPWKNVLFCFLCIAWVQLGYGTKNFDFEMDSNTLIFFEQKK